MPSNLLGIWIITSLLALPALGREIKGRVLTSEKKPVGGAVVLSRAGGSKVITDTEGAFTLEVPDAEKVKVEVIHPDYYEQEFLLLSRDLGAEVVLSVVPLIKQREEIVVTALRYPELSSSVPAAGTVLAKETLAGNIVPNIMEGLQSTPGVAALGSGGFSLVPTIRGLARRRILYLVDFARIESDRRTGPNASFVSPGDIDRIEVLRSPSSVLYGSDAIGGVVHILMRTPELRPGIRGRVSTHYASVNSEKGVGLALEGARKSTGFLLSFNGLDAGDYSSPQGRIPQSQYTQKGAYAKVTHRTARREVNLSFLAARGTDIGKPNLTSATKPTWYPKENVNLLQLRWVENGLAGGGLTVHVFVNPNFLETRTDTYKAYRTQESFSRSKGTEYGLQLSFGRAIGTWLRLEGGVDTFGRAGARADNSETSFDAAGGVTKVFLEKPYTDGRRKDIGVFISADCTGLKKLDILTGLRWDSLSMEARPGGGEDVSRISRTAWTGFLATSYKLTPELTAFANISRAYRLPSLSELFYTGITGRGFIISNPDLRAETSFNLDGGVRWIGRRFFAGIYAFSYEIADMIERYKMSGSIYTYGNIDKGRIKGLELEAEVFPLSGWKIFGNLFTFKGKSLSSGAALNDIPPFQAVAGTRIWIGRFSAEVAARIQARKDNPGPAEVSIPAAEVVSLRTLWILDGYFSVFLNMTNVFNETYIARPDPEAVEEPGRSISLGISCSF